MIRKRHLYALAFLIVMLCGYLLDVQITNTRIYKEVNAGSLTPGINLSEVTELVISKPQQKDIKIVYEQKYWVIMEPIRGLADPEIITQILTNVTGARKRNEINAKNLAEYGLAKPDVTLSLKTSGGKTFRLALGYASTYTGQVFAQVNDEKSVITVGEQVRNCLLRNPNDLRMARLFDVDNSQIEKFNRIKIYRKDSDYDVVLEKQQSGQWLITQPSEWAAETAIVNDWIRNCGQLKASGFVGESGTRAVTQEEAKAALDGSDKSKAVMFVEISRADAGAMTLNVANAGTSSTPVYVADRSISREIVTLTNSSIESIAEPQSFFMSRDIYTMKPANVKSLKIAINRDTTELTRDADGTWYLAQDKSTKIDQKKVNTTVDLLLSKKIKNYVDLAPPEVSAYGLAPVPRFIYTLTSTDNVVETLECGRSETGNPTMVYGRRAGSAPVFTIDFGSDLVLTENMITDKHFLRPSDGTQVKEIRIATSTDNDLQYVFTMDERGVWNLLKPLQQVPTVADKGKLARMLEELTGAVYERDYKSNNGEQSIISPDLDVTTLKITYLGTVGNDPKRQELLSVRFGKRQPKGTLAESAADKRIYEIKPQQMSRLDSAVKLAIQQ